MSEKEKLSKFAKHAIKVMTTEKKKMIVLNQNRVEVKVQLK